MEFLATYTLPAQKKSLDIFKETWFYFFWITSTTKIDFDALGKATYLWLWYEYELKDSEDEYIKIMKMWEIRKIWDFKIDPTGEIIGDYSWEIELKSAFNKHFSNLHKFIDGTIKTELPNIIGFIQVTNIIDVHENILYPSKQFIAFPIINKWNYQKHILWINAFKINNCMFFVNEDKIELPNWKIEKLWNDWIYCKILELLCKSDNFEFDWDNHIDLMKKITSKSSRISDNTILWFNRRLSKILWFHIKYEQGVFKKK